VIENKDLSGFFRKYEQIIENTGSHLVVFSLPRVAGAPVMSVSFANFAHRLYRYSSKNPKAEPDSSAYSVTVLRPSFTLTERSASCQEKPWGERTAQFRWESWTEHCQGTAPAVPKVAK